MLEAHVSAQAAVIRYCSLGGLNQKFLSVLDAGRLRLGCQQRQGHTPVRTLVLACRRPPSPCTLAWQGESSAIPSGPHSYDLI